MTNYNEVLKIAKELQEDFPKQITFVDALKVAVHIQQSNVISRAFLQGEDINAQPLEAIAIVLGYKPGRDDSSILSTLKSMNEND